MTHAENAAITHRSISKASLASIFRYPRFKQRLTMADFDPKTDVLNNAINEPGWTILDVRNADELD